MAVEVSPYLLRRVRSLNEVLAGEEDPAPGLGLSAGATPGHRQPPGEPNGGAEASSPPTFPQKTSADAA